MLAATPRLAGLFRNKGVLRVFPAMRRPAKRAWPLDL